MKQPAIQIPLIPALIFALLSSSCTVSPFKKGDPGSRETLVIVGTNDIHGTLSPLPLKSREKGGAPSIAYTAGGAAMLSSTIQRLKSEFGSSLIWLDGGDQFQGSVDSNLELGAPMVAWFNANGLSAAAVGNHEFDFGPENLKKRMSEAKYPYLAANILDRSKGGPADFPNTHPHVILNAGGLKVGVLGLSTEETPKTTRPGNVKDYVFENLKEATLREAAALRKLGANIVVITTHAGLLCDIDKPQASNKVWTPTDVQGECSLIKEDEFGHKDEIVRLLQSIPAGTVDAVVSGHTHTVVHHWVAGVPVIQGGSMGRYINVIYLTYDWKTKQVVPESTKIEGPIPICEMVFEHQQDCNGDRPAPKNGRGKLVPPTLHGQTLLPDQKSLDAIKALARKTKSVREKKVGHAVLPVEHTTHSESQMGNILADAIRESSQSDMAIINNGIIRATLESGPLTYEDLFRAIPFDNIVSTVKVTAKALKMILRVAESGARGFPSVSGMILTLIDPTRQAPFDDLNGSGRFEQWETNRLLDVRLPNGERLDPNRLYQLATLDFLVLGGDDYAWAMKQIPKDHIQIDTGVLARDALIRYIEKFSPIQTEGHHLVNPKKPRLVFKKP